MPQSRASNQEVRLFNVIISGMDETPPLSISTYNPFGDLIGLHFDSWGDGRSLCRIELTPKLLNPNGVTHGAVLYAMADTGMGGALLTTLDGGRYCTTVEIKISYFRALRSQRLSCESWVVHRGKRIAFLEAAVSDDDGLVAQASGTFAILEPRGAA